MKIAIVHDWLTNMGGAEKVVEIFHEIYPDAPVYTLIYNRDNVSSLFRDMQIRTSYLQYLPLAKKKHQWYLQFMPLAIEQFDFSEYDLVLSSSSACAKGVLTGVNTCHICYCHTPMRYAWDFYHRYIRSKNSLIKSYIAYQLNKIRIWDKMSADRVDYFIANSHYVANRIRKHYRRKARVIYPPVDTNFFIPQEQGVGDYFLCAGRLVGYKRIDIAVEAFNRIGLPLLVAGEGPEYKLLKKIAGNTIKFVGRVNNEQLMELYQGCRAFVFPGEEDFGIMPLESQACGRPVIAFGKGGAMETVIGDETGVFFYQQTLDALVEAIKYFISIEERYSTKIIRDHAERFNIDRFKSQVSSFVEENYIKFKINNRMKWSV